LEALHKTIWRKSKKFALRSWSQLRSGRGIKIQSVEVAKGLSMAWCSVCAPVSVCRPICPSVSEEAPTDAREASGAALVDGVLAYSQNRFSARLRHRCSPETW
jgi:hypothetical protein